MDDLVAKRPHFYAAQTCTGRGAYQIAGIVNNEVRCKSASRVFSGTVI